VQARKYLLPHKPLGDRFRNEFKERLLEDHPDLFQQVPASVWERHWNVGCQAAGSGENALRYLARYVFKTATSNRALKRLPDGQVCWPYRESKSQKDTVVKLEPMEWMRRFLQHILPAHFARVRTFGWLHPAAKVRGNRVRALLREEPVLTEAEKAAWQPPADPEEAAPPDPQPSTVNPQPHRCPLCGKAMRLVEIWNAGDPPPLPNRPP
jgi:hypothetical protein